MAITRREFAIGTSMVTLTVLGCEPAAQPTAAAPPDGSAKEPAATDDVKAKNKANLATEPFVVGPPHQYTNPGLYESFKSDKGVWLISDGKSLVALSATCTHLGCTTHWKADRSLFECPCHESRFSLEGMNRGGKSKRPMERCAVRVVESDNGPQVEVDPTRRFRQERGEWSDPASSLTLS